MSRNGSSVGSQGRGLDSAYLGASPGSVGSYSGHFTLPPSFSVNFSRQSHLGWSVMLGMEIPTLNVEKDLKVASSNPFPESWLCTHSPTHPCLSLNTSPGGSLITYKAARLVYLVRQNRPPSVASTGSAFGVLLEQVHTLCSSWPLRQ